MVARQSVFTSGRLRRVVLEASAVVEELRVWAEEKRKLLEQARGPASAATHTHRREESENADVQETSVGAEA